MKKNEQLDDRICEELKETRKELKEIRKELCKINNSIREAHKLGQQHGLY